LSSRKARIAAGISQARIRRRKPANRIRNNASMPAASAS
jgi:hypothetical protein